VNELIAKLKEIAGSNQVNVSKSKAKSVQNEA
jgi:hypothetical protein